MCRAVVPDVMSMRHSLACVGYTDMVYMLCTTRYLDHYRSSDVKVLYEQEHLAPRGSVSASEAVHGEVRSCR